ncbi:GNAT family N-acetyltransferase [Oricola sp.]|uniref:GNAT family N-acetyltransferase n=1 Tax=Oricola sp. TaxID=1979950 RepID=UPI003204F171
MRDLSKWEGCALPNASVLDGRFVRLERLTAADHGDGLYDCSTMPDAAERFRWLPEFPPRNRAEFQTWLDKAEASRDPLYYAIIDKASGKVAGRQTLLRIDAANGVVEIGHVLWSSLMARKPAATEAFYLLARHVFDDLGYRRFEWKCNDHNEPSKRAAIRFGMVAEGVFRQAAVVKGANRDTAWFSMIDGEWPMTRASFETWLAPKNFDETGHQRTPLSTLNARQLIANGLKLHRVGLEAQSTVETLQALSYARTRNLIGAEPIPLEWDYREILAECEVWVFDRENKPAGALILRRREDDLYVESIATMPAVAGYGYGRAMMAAAFNRAETLRLPKVRLMTNTLNPALDWYRRLGFVVEGEETLGDRKALHMVAAVA